ncbi:hypothetical protein GCM10012280_16120 [Wenjunlia tyrosinilytica]|uniref:Uncharacterized protein n=1 Tax=Wenjunlia tyrosinilytica TaxID=1544741 RepID=A0A918DV32_9ACTN|nr:hypothetical protein GCM10012280_16120 [Wenjunlia tyrosinilytica]
MGRHHRTRLPVRATSAVAAPAVGCDSNEAGADRQGAKDTAATAAPSRTAHTGAPHPTRSGAAKDTRGTADVNGTADADGTNGGTPTAGTGAKAAPGSGAPGNDPPAVAGTAPEGAPASGPGISPLRRGSDTASCAPR